MIPAYGRTGTTPSEPPTPAAIVQRRVVGDNGPVSSTDPYPFDAPRSSELMERARAVTPGGVNSPVRAFRAVGGTPRFIGSAAGAYVTDADGRRYVDLVSSWGALLHGHAHPEVVAAVTRAAAAGTSYGAPTEAEVDLCGSSRPAPRRRCRPSGWPAGSPGATWS
jgi:glutamate-1-semialdehyde 2,1-aminomutase